MMENKKIKNVLNQIYEEMKQHVGKENSISASELSMKFHMSKRTLREYIREIRRNDDFDLVLVSDTNGYYVSKSRSEYEKANHRLYASALNMIKTAQSNERKAGLDGQWKIKYEGMDKECIKAFGIK